MMLLKRMTTILKILLLIYNLRNIGTHIKKFPKIIFRKNVLHSKFNILEIIFILLKMHCLTELNVLEKLSILNFSNFSSYFFFILYVVQVIIN